MDFYLANTRITTSNSKAERTAKKSNAAPSLKDPHDKPNDLKSVARYT